MGKIWAFVVFKLN